MARFKTFSNGGSVLPGDLNSIEDDHDIAFSSYKALGVGVERVSVIGSSAAAATYPLGVQDGAVTAAADGKVIFSDRLSSYGNVIIVEHSGGFTTVYAHNERNLVRKGARIRRGEKIATLGASGRARTPHLHFEVRKDNVARNPLYYLPR